jgi:hypothetical protein
MSLNCSHQQAYFAPQIYRHREPRLNDTDKGKPKKSVKTLSWCHHVPSRIQHGLTRERTRASVVRGRQLTAIRRLKIVKMLTGNYSVLEAATEMSVLTGPSDSSGGCQSALVDKLGVSPKQYHPWSTSKITRGWTEAHKRSQFWDVSLAPS